MTVPVVQAQVAGSNIASSSMIVSTMQENIMDESDSSAQVIRTFSPELAIAIRQCVLGVAIRCFSEGIITKACYASIVKQHIDDELRTHLLLLAVIDAITINNNCFYIFVDDILKKELAPKLVETLLPEIKMKHPGFLNGILNDLSGIYSVSKRNPIKTQLTGCLATTMFKMIETAFQEAIHGGKVKEIKSAAKKMSKANSDFHAIGLLYKASCRALMKGQLKQALKDCDKAMKVASPTECQNRILITLRALRIKTAILRTMGEYSKALECLSEAYQYFNTVAPSYDTAALLYEKIRLEMSIVDDNVTFSDVQVGYRLTLEHADASRGDDFSQVVIFLNSKAEVVQKSSVIRDGRLSPAPTEDELCMAEKILKLVPVNKLPEEAYVYRGWHYLAQSDLYTWRKQYVEAKEWAKKSRQQFASGGITYVDAPQKRLELLRRLQI